MMLLLANVERINLFLLLEVFLSRKMSLALQKTRKMKFIQIEFLLTRRGDLISSNRKFSADILQIDTLHALLLAAETS